MDVYRAHTPKNIGFTVVYNSVIEDERLRDGALEVLIYLLSKPDGWMIRQADLYRRFGYTDYRMRKINRILMDAHYLVRERVHGAGGRITWRHAVYDLPQDPKFDPYGHRGKKAKPGGGEIPWES